MRSDGSRLVTDRTERTDGPEREGGSASDAPGASGRRRSRFATESRLIEQTLAVRSGTIIWTAERGGGKSELLRWAAALLATPHRRPALTVVDLVDGARRGSATAESAPGSPPSGIARLAHILDTAEDRRAVIALADDVDRWEPAARDELLTLATARRSGFVLLGTAGPAFPTPDLPGARVQPLDPMGASDALSMLRDDHGLTVAPHVATTLTRLLGGNPGCLIETAALLLPDQLLGRSALPDPLPATALANAICAEPLDLLDAGQRHSLLVAAVAVVDRLETLCAAAGISADEVVRGPLSGMLHLLAGGFAFADPRLRSVAHEAATLAERTDAHRRLERTHRDRGEAQLAAWHGSLADPTGGDETVGELIALARRALDRGDSGWAHAVARHAARQAGPRRRRSAEYLAGVTALQSGCTVDAADWLGRVIRSRHRGLALRALAPFAVAVTWARGHVPDAEVRRAAEELGDSVESAADPDGRLARLAAHGVEALAVIACLHAERGTRHAGREALDAARELARRHRTDTPLLEMAEEWCSGFGLPSGGPGADRRLASSGLAAYGVVARAIALVAAGDAAGAGGAGDELATASLALTPAHWVSGVMGSEVIGSEEPAATPLLEAHLRVAGALVQITRGHLAEAADELERAAYATPMALPFAGLGVAAARRLDILIGGVASDAGAAPRPPTCPRRPSCSPSPSSMRL